LVFTGIYRQRIGLEWCEGLRCSMVNHSLSMKILMGVLYSTPQNLCWSGQHGPFRYAKAIWAEHWLWSYAQGLVIVGIISTKVLCELNLGFYLLPVIGLWRCLARDRHRVCSNKRVKGGKSLLGTTRALQLDVNPSASQLERHSMSSRSNQSLGRVTELRWRLAKPDRQPAISCIVSSGMLGQNSKCSTQT
jgi:hypothetical protein